MNLAIALHTAGRVSSTPDEFHTIAKGGIHCSRRQIVGQRGCLPATVIGQSHVFVRCNCNYCRLFNHYYFRHSWLNFFDENTIIVDKVKLQR